MHSSGQDSSRYTDPTAHTDVISRFIGNDSAEHSEYKASTTPIRLLADDEKPREKALRHGIGALSDAEVLAILLGSGIPGKSVLDLSREILADCGGRLRLLSKMDVGEFSKKYKGIGKAKALLLVAAINFGARVQQSLGSLDPQILSSRSVDELMRQQLQHLSQEEFWVLNLNRSNRLIKAACISRGGLSATVVDIKLIAKSALDNLASGIILVHNHPSGNLQPSQQDNQLTRKIVEMCRIIDVNVLDHVIIAPGGLYSYRDSGNPAL